MWFERRDSEDGKITFIREDDLRKELREYYLRREHEWFLERIDIAIDALESGHAFGTDDAGYKRVDPD